MYALRLLLGLAAFLPPAASTPGSAQSSLRGAGRVLTEFGTTLTPVETHGQLQVRGNRIVDQHGQPTRLRGMSLFWSQWGGHYWNRATVHWLRSDWRISVLRASLGVKGIGEGASGYLVNPDSEKKKLIAVVEAAIEVGIYVIIDWHDHHADKNALYAKAFFSEMAQKFGNFPNVLFEPFNEPTPELSWALDIKPYHTQIVAEIRKHTENIVILGCGEWSQHVDVAAKDPVAGTNLAYAVHFYAPAPAHNAPLQARVGVALGHGVPVFATEWGVCDYTGTEEKGLAKDKANEWLDFMAKNFISDTNWAVNDKRETCSVLRPGASFGGGWAPADLTEAGEFVRETLRGDGASSCSAVGQDCRSTLCCGNSTMTCYERDPDWGECRPQCANGMYAKISNASLSWTCDDIGRKAVVDTSSCVAAGKDCRVAQCCQDPAMQCYEKNQWWASCRSGCTTGDASSNDAWSCVLLDRFSTTQAVVSSTVAPTAVPTTLAPTIAPTESPVPCSLQGHDCRSSSCCSNSSLKCFEKDQNWAECRASCLPDISMDDAPEWRSPWSCKTLDHPSHTCADEGQDCRSSKCCSISGLTCFAKNEYWAECKASCIPGIDLSDALEWRTPWSCVALDADATAGTTTLANIASPCTADGQDCRSSKCCSTPGMTCFAKDEHWAECKASCEPGIDLSDALEWRTPWSCVVIDQTVIAGSTTLATTASPCTANGQDCRASKCCSTPGLTCFAKDEHWAECKASCIPGIDLSDALEWRTPWSCAALDGTAIAGTTTVAPILVPCAVGGQDCRSSMCCGDPSLTCFEKDRNWAECKASCEPGIDLSDAPEWRTPWSCIRLNRSAVAVVQTTTNSLTSSPCSVGGQDCRVSKCCSNSSLSCFEKDPNWAECKASCVPGIDMNDALEWRTPWTCNEL